MVISVAWLCGIVGALLGFGAGLLLVLLVSIRYERHLARAEKALDAELLRGRTLEAEMYRLSMNGQPR